MAAQRHVAVQEGPLYRTEGSHVTIWCNVSGFQGPSEQNFQWSIYLPSAPEREVQIVSTVDSSFPYAIYTQRVRSGKIYVERVQGNSALLHITDLQARDAGEYECYTPNTDEQYFGSYSAKMSLVGKEMAIAVRRCPAWASPSVRLSWPERLRQQALTPHGLDAGRRPGVSSGGTPLPGCGLPTSHRVLTWWTGREGAL